MKLNYLQLMVMVCDVTCASTPPSATPHPLVSHTLRSYVGKHLICHSKKSFKC